MVKNILLIVGLTLILGYGVLWLLSFKTYPIEFGASFNQNHAISLGLDWKKTYLSMLTDLRPKYIRVAAMWSDVEHEQGKFDFTDVDFMLDEAAKKGAKVTLVVGQKAPRWPECHVPQWFQNSINKNDSLLRYINETVTRYKNHPALEIWQVENEPFLIFKFGDCANYNRDLVTKEIAAVRALDPDHKIMITDSGELSTWRRSIWAGDIFGTTVYRVVRTPNGLVFYYDWLPAGFYRVKAKLFGRSLSNVFVAELQAEPWFVDSNPDNTSIDDQEKTMNPKRLARHINYVRHIGTPRAYLWGVEWWAFMKEKRGDSRYWDLVKDTMVGR